VPATAFCEPNDRRPAGAKATWHWFALRGVEPRPPFSFAGIWQAWEGPLKKDGPTVILNTYSILTTIPNSATASINHERSPVLLTTDMERNTWLDGATEDALTLVRPIDGDRLAIVQVGLEKQDLLA
jgi:putative SOS response-associated peptidase YedK